MSWSNVRLVLARRPGDSDLVGLGLEGLCGTGLEYLTGLCCDARAHLYMDIQGMCGLDKGIMLCSQELRSAEGVICESEVYHF